MILRLVLVALAVIAGLAVTVVAATWFVQRRLIYFPLSAPVMAAGDVVAGARDVRLHTEDGLELGAWWIPATGGGSRATVIVFNGNAGDRSLRLSLATGLASRQVDVMLFDYRGYGGNPGRPSAIGLALDARAARDAVRRLPEAADRPVVYLGESLGAAVALELALEHPPAALILRSPFTSLVDVARQHYPFLPADLLLLDRYPSRRRVVGLASPLLVLAGQVDRIVPAAQSRALFEAAPEPKEWLLVPGVGHNDPEFAGGKRMLDAVDRFLRSTLEGAGTGAPAVSR